MDDDAEDFEHEEDFDDGGRDDGSRSGGEDIPDADANVDMNTLMDDKYRRKGLRAFIIPRHEERIIMGIDIKGEKIETNGTIARVESTDRCVYSVPDNKLYETLSDSNSDTCQKCWWCFQPRFITHEEKGNLIFFRGVSGYNRRQKRFTLRGYYCSPQCAKADLRSKSGDKYCGTFSHFYKLYYGLSISKANIRPAPSKYVLRDFGGPMTTEQYRKLLLENTAVTQTTLTDVHAPNFVNLSTEILCETKSTRPYDEQSLSVEQRSSVAPLQQFDAPPVKTLGHTTITKTETDTAMEGFIHAQHVKQVRKGFKRSKPLARPKHVTASGRPPLRAIKSGAPQKTARVQRNEQLQKQVTDAASPMAYGADVNNPFDMTRFM